MSVPCIVADLRAPDSLFSQIEATRPELVVNAAGVVKQRNYEAAELWEVNARFPHRVVEVCRRSGARLIHLSTDCVFSGREGGYTETDEPDPVDDYGRSKREGEPKGENVMVIRTSMIGLERSHGVGRVEWFLDQRGIVRGFSQAIFSGLTTKALSRLIRDHCAKDGFRSGIWHLPRRVGNAWILDAIGHDDDPIGRKMHFDRELVYGRLQEELKRLCAKGDRTGSEQLDQG